MIIARDCINDKILKYSKESDSFTEQSSAKISREDMPFIGPGLIDLHINGVNGVDFNDTSLNDEGLLSATKYLLGMGVTEFFPTVITNSVHNTRQILSAIDKACLAQPLLDQCIGGIHLEGPFISRSDGYRGAHKKSYVMAPDWDLFCSFQRASGNRVRIISLSPEWDNAVDFIKRGKQEGLLVAIAHSRADTRQVQAAVEAGAGLSSHLGNSLPLMIPRHPNIIWDQLAEDRLYASIIADGFHLPDSFIRVVLKTKKKKTILVSDATHFSGLTAGIYETHIGNEVVLEEDGRLSIKGSGGLLAGATKLLTENVQYLISKKLADTGRAWYMASVGPAKLLGYENRQAVSRSGDFVLFNIKDGRIVIYRVYKNGKPVWNGRK